MIWFRLLMGHAPLDETFTCTQARSISTLLQAQSFTAVTGQEMMDS